MCRNNVSTCSRAGRAIIRRLATLAEDSPPEVAAHEPRACEDGACEVCACEGQALEDRVCEVLSSKCLHGERCGVFKVFACPGCVPAPDSCHKFFWDTACVPIAVEEFCVYNNGRVVCCSTPKARRGAFERASREFAAAEVAAVEAAAVECAVHELTGGEVSTREDSAFETHPCEPRAAEPGAREVCLAGKDGLLEAQACEVLIGEDGAFKAGLFEGGACKVCLIDQCLLCEERAVEVCPVEGHVAQGGAREVCVRKVPPGKVEAARIDLCKGRPSEICARGQCSLFKGGPFKVRALQPRPCEIDAGEDGFRKLCLGEVGALEAHACELRPTEISLLQENALKPGRRDVRPGKGGPAQHAGGKEDVVHSAALEHHARHSLAVEHGVAEVALLEDAPRQLGVPCEDRVLQVVLFEQAITELLPVEFGLARVDPAQILVAEHNHLCKLIGTEWHPSHSSAFFLFFLSCCFFFKLLKLEEIT